MKKDTSQKVLESNNLLKESLIILRKSMIKWEE